MDSRSTGATAAPGPRLAIVSTYPPRRCGVAAFTADMRTALHAAHPSVDPVVVVVAVDDGVREYGAEVVAVVGPDDPGSSYVAAADGLVRHGVDIVVVQHEFGVFGGPDDAHVVTLARALTARRVPYLVTLHSVPSRLTEGRAATLRALCGNAARVVVFTQAARRFAVRTGLARERNVIVVPHPTADATRPVAEAPGVADAAGPPDSTAPWAALADRAVALLGEVVRESRRKAGRAGIAPVTAPPLCLSHLRRLTDEIGVVRPGDGYRVDEAARLGVVAADLLTTGLERRVAEQWAATAVRFLTAAYDPRTGRMRRELSYQGAWTDDPYLGDHVAAAVWGLGAVAGCRAVPGVERRRASALLDVLAPQVAVLARLGPEPAALAVLGLAAAGEPTAERGEALADALRVLTDGRDGDPAWSWAGGQAGPATARPAQAVVAGAARLGDDQLARQALAVLDGYADAAGLTRGVLEFDGPPTTSGHGPPDGWVERATDVGATVEALVAAWRYAGDPRYARLAGCAYGWFTGRNRRGLRMYAEDAGGCHDALTRGGATPRQSAEATLAYHQALLALARTGLAVLPDSAPGVSGPPARPAHTPPRLLHPGRERHPDVR